jgi:hypothetical protein
MAHKAMLRTNTLASYVEILCDSIKTINIDY